MQRFVPCPSYFFFRITSSDTLQHRNSTMPSQRSRSRLNVNPESMTDPSVVVAVVAAVVGSPQGVSQQLVSLRVVARQNKTAKAVVEEALLEDTQLCRNGFIPNAYDWLSFFFVHDLVAIM